MLCYPLSGSPVAALLRLNFTSIWNKNREKMRLMNVRGLRLKKWGWELNNTNKYLLINCIVAFVLQHLAMTWVCTYQISKNEREPSLSYLTTRIPQVPFAMMPVWWWNAATRRLRRGWYLYVQYCTSSTAGYRRLRRTACSPMHQSQYGRDCPEHRKKYRDNTGK